MEKDKEKKEPVREVSRDQVIIEAAERYKALPEDLRARLRAEFIEAEELARWISRQGRIDWSVFYG